MKKETVILSAYREAVLSAREKGLKGPVAAAAAVRAAAKIASKLLGEAVTEDDIRRLRASGE